MARQALKRMENALSKDFCLFRTKLDLIGAPKHRNVFLELRTVHLRMKTQKMV